MNSKTYRTVLGVDPGTTVLGYSVVRFDGIKPELLVMGVMELKKYASHYEKLGKIFDRIDSIIKEYKPEELSIESPFFGKNVQSMLKLGRAQGVAMAAAIKNGLPVFEYAPREIKTAVTGSGSASKEQLANILKIEMKIEDMPVYMDASDALGAAVCHLYRTKITKSKKTSGNWEDFLKNNPDRIKGKTF